MPDKEFAVWAKPQGAVLMVVKSSGNRHEHGFAIGESYVRVLRVRDKSGKSFDFWAGVVAIAAILSYVNDIDISINGEVRVQRQAKHSSVVKCIDIRTDIKKRCG